MSAEDVGGHVPGYRPDQAWCAAGYNAPQADGDVASDGFHEPAAGSRLQSIARRPYCPSRYEGGAELPGGADRAALLRSQIRQIQELRCQAEKTGRSAEKPPGPVGVPTPQRARPGAQALVTRLPLPVPSQPCPPLQPPQAPQPQDRLSSILSFLDEVEETSRADISSLVSSARSSKPPCDSWTGTCADTCGGGTRYDPGGSTGSTACAVGPGLAADAAALQSRISLLEVEVGDKKKIIDALRRALSDSKLHEQQTVQETVREWDDKLQRQKTHYEASIERHLKMVDKLLNDKTELTKRCELLAEEIKAVEKKFQMKMEQLDEQASKDLVRHKQNWVATEKLRREAWEKEKVREIKELTIKGLQPDVERIMAERKQEKAHLEVAHREALESQRQEMLEQAQVQLGHLRAQLLKEQEHALDQERQAHRHKLRDEFERFNADLSHERAKCAADLLAEQRKCDQLLRQRLDDYEARGREATAAERAEAESMLREARAEAARAAAGHQSELLGLGEEFRLRQEEARREHAEQAQSELLAREAALREELSSERDKQLDVVMERLSRDHVAEQCRFKEESAALAERARAEAGERARHLGAELREVAGQVAALESQRADLEGALQRQREDCSAASARAACLEDSVRRCRHENSALQEDSEKRARDSEMVLEERRGELLRVAGAKDEEVRAAHEELQLLRVQVAEEQALARAQREEASRREEQIISDLEARVKRTLHAKDEAIGELRLRCMASENKLREFEFLLARQREELLSGITMGVRS